MNSGSWFGRLTRPVNIKMRQNGAKSAFFTLACDKRNSRRIEQLNQQDGGHRPTADFIPCSIFGYGASNGRPANNKRVDAIANNVHKGDLFGVTGPINTWSKKNPDGTFDDNWSVQVQSFQFGGSNSGSHSSSNAGGVSHGKKNIPNPFAGPSANNKPSNPSAPQSPKTPNPSAPSNPPKTPNPSGKKPSGKKGNSDKISDDDLPF